MLFHHGYINSALVTIKAAYKAQFNRELFVPTAEFSKFVNENSLGREHDVIAHFSKVIAYYSRKHKFIPTWKHLISPSVPVISCAAVWDAMVAKKYPYFRPWMFKPQQSDFSSDYDVAALIPSQGIINLVLDFCVCITDAYTLTYVPTAVRLIERLVYTMEYRNDKRERAFMDAISAHNRLRAIRKQRRDTNSAWLLMHWSRALVRQQQIKYRNQLFSMWEIPKIMVNPEAYKATFGKNQNSHDVDVLMSLILEYGQRFSQYTKFMLTCRDSFILTKKEADEWRNSAPMGLKFYPLLSDGDSNG